MITKGKPFNGLLLQATDSIEETEFGMTIQRKFRALYSKYRDSVPKVKSPHPVFTLCQLKTIRAEQIGSADLCDVFLIYVQETFGSSISTAVPPVEINETGSTIEIDIRSHLKFTSDFKTHWDEDKQCFKLTAPDYLRGTSKYVVGAGQVAVTTFSHGRPSSVLPLCGKRGNPGNGLGEDGHWLVLTGGVSKRGAFWGRTLVYQYSSKPVPPEIYD